MKERIEALSKKLEQEKGKRQQLLTDIKAAKKELKLLGKDLRRHEQAKEIIKEVGLKTQENIQYHVGGITSLALEAIFPDDPYELKVNFLERRDKTECDLMFVRDGLECNPLTASGGGAVDVASLALRIASWAMENPRKRNVMILDEPLRYLSKNLQEQGSKMIKELSEKLNLQFIIITHEEILTEYADRVFEVRLKKGISQVSTKNE